ncbi:uncharacterized protein MELLADRAFT_94642 [Melampsora larici-populina 98AG31]|uniref:Uncharacterized protein n=1 Tax=Melampsora larici-populina (strain 98AG31 / pathotype 3-4-7) TaxID=747676 RepID=F4S7F6_MELLP|nr:uncharacterized protein MELLADRAFT_94642 [Melampsora larici-populina 98AG31]EGF99400.1 hypothetical protein MELLADRAFT_94642 [Melampsora larici-populina 98AG31]
MGYLAASPSQPRTAFSVRLINHHHAQSIRFAVPTEGYCSALDDVLNNGSPEPPDWRGPFTVAVDTYRAILLKIRDRELSLLFWPPVGNVRPEEPHIVVCIDGNFQHKRHARASVPIPGWHPPRPSIFLDPKLVNAKEQFMSRTPDVPLDGVHDPCTEAHTAANDARGRGHFKNMDESGLLGMGCRHDNVLQYINLIQSGEKRHNALAFIEWLLKLLKNDRDGTTTIGILYDIGCNLDKTIKKLTATSPQCLTW